MWFNVSKMMRMLSIFLLMVQFSMATEGQTVFSLRKQRIKSVDLFKAIKQQTGYSVLYSNQTLDDNKVFFVEFQQADLNVVMKKVLENSALTYEIKDKLIIISNAPAGKVSEQMQRAIQGTVRSENGTPLQGASVSIAGTNKATSTNASGEYVLNNVQNGETVVIRYVGYKPQSLTVGSNSSVLNIVLVAEDNTIENVVVTALGIKRQERALSYNTQQVKGEELTRNRDANFMNSLTGKVAGVTINAGSSGIGGATRVVMRGGKSISGNNNALYVIDGVPVLNTTNLSSNKPAGEIVGPFAANTTSDIISLLH